TLGIRQDEIDWESTLGETRDQVYHHAFGSAAFQSRQEEREGPFPIANHLSWLFNPGQHVRAETWTRIEDGIHRRVKSSHGASDGRRQGQPTHMHAACREQLAYPGNRN